MLDKISGIYERRFEIYLETPFFMENGYGALHFKDWNKSYIPDILKELYIDHIYGKYLYGKKDLTIFDLGLNIGLFSLFASQFAKQIYAFEPDLTSFELAKKNMESNNITNIKLFQKAIAKEDGLLDFYESVNTTANSLIPVMELTGQKSISKTKVEAIRLDTFVKQEDIKHIDFMKMDIEGSECEVIGSKSFEGIVPLLDAFVVEYHEWSGVNVQQLVTTIRDYGYTVELIPSKAVILGAVKNEKLTNI
jgi:FkbM family methyltransferase